MNNTELLDFFLTRQVQNIGLFKRSVVLLHSSGVLPRTLRPKSKSLFRHYRESGNPASLYTLERGSPILT